MMGGSIIVTSCTTMPGPGIYLAYQTNNLVPRLLPASVACKFKTGEETGNETGNETS